MWVLGSSASLCFRALFSISCTPCQLRIQNGNGPCERCKKRANIVATMPPARRRRLTLCEVYQVLCTDPSSEGNKTKAKVGILPVYDLKGARYGYRTALVLAQEHPGNWQLLIPGAGNAPINITTALGVPDTTFTVRPRVWPSGFSCRALGF